MTAVLRTSLAVHNFYAALLRTATNECIGIVARRVLSFISPAAAAASAVVTSSTRVGARGPGGGGGAGPHTRVPPAAAAAALAAANEPQTSMDPRVVRSLLICVLRRLGIHEAAATPLALSAAERRQQASIVAIILKNQNARLMPLLRAGLDTDLTAGGSAGPSTVPPLTDFDSLIEAAVNGRDVMALLIDAYNASAAVPPVGAAMWLAQALEALQEAMLSAPNLEVRTNKVLEFCESAPYGSMA
jgi:hypothetical protein